MTVEEASDERVVGQVNPGEIMSSPAKKAFRAIHSKREDRLLVNTKADPQFSIEGAGHHQGIAAVRDAIGKESLRRAA